MKSRRQKAKAKVNPRDANTDELTGNLLLVPSASEEAAEQKVEKEPSTHVALADAFLHRRMVQGIGFSRLRCHKGTFWEFNGDEKHLCWYRCNSDALTNELIRFVGARIPYDPAKNAAAVSKYLEACVEVLNPPCFLSFADNLEAPAEGWVATKNGLLNPRRFALGLHDSFRKPDPRYFSTENPLPVDFDPAADPTPTGTFKQLLDYALDPHAQTLLKRLFASILLGRQPQRLFILQGPGGLGKGSVARLFSAILGDFKGFSLPMLKDQTTRVALAAHRAIINWDSPSDKAHKVIDSEVEEIVKSWTGGDPISGRVVYSKTAVSVTPKGPMILISNTLPSFRDTATFNRILVIPFEGQSQRGAATEIEKIEDRVLREDAPRVLTWLLQGVTELLAAEEAGEQVFTPHPKGLAMLNDHRNGVDAPRAFFSEQVEAHTEGKLGRQELFDQFADYAKKNGFGTYSKPTFEKALKEVFPAIEDGRHRLNTSENPTRCWVGIRLVS